MVCLICSTRGKCSVSLLNELEDIHTYLDKEDTFFFTMVYDPNQKTLLVDKGEIRVGTDYQAEIGPYVDPGMDPTVSQSVLCSVFKLSRHFNCLALYSRGQRACHTSGHSNLGAQSLA